MYDELIYPKNLDDLIKKNEFIIKEEQNFEIINNITKWNEWFKKLDYKLSRKLNEEEFLKMYYDNGIYALQVWKHDSIVDSIVVNLVCNNYNVYNDENTKVVID